MKITMATYNALPASMRRILPGGKLMVKSIRAGKEAWVEAIIVKENK